MAEPSKTEPQRPRGTGFPTLSLPEAVQLIEKVGKYGRQQAISSLASHFGNSENSSSFNLKIAALRDWGFLEGSRATSFTLTEAAMTIAHPPSRDDKERTLLAAFRRSGVFWQVYESLTKNVELELASIGNLAVTSFGIGIPSKEKFVRSLVESAVLVNLAEQVGTGIVRLKALEDSNAVPAQRAPEPSISSEKERPEGVTESQRSDINPVLRQSWPTDNGEISLTVYQTSPLPATVFVQLGKVAEEIEALAKMLRTSEEA